MSFKKTNLKL